MLLMSMIKTSAFRTLVILVLCKSLEDLQTQLRTQLQKPKVGSNNRSRPKHNHLECVLARSLLLMTIVGSSAFHTLVNIVLFQVPQYLRTHFEPNFKAKSWLNNRSRPKHNSLTKCRKCVFAKSLLLISIVGNSAFSIRASRAPSSSLLATLTL